MLARPTSTNTHPGTLAGFVGAHLAAVITLPYLNGDGPGELEHGQGRQAGSREGRIDFGVEGWGVALGGATGQQQRGRSFGGPARRGKRRS